MKWIGLVLALFIGGAQAQSPVLPGPGLPPSASASPPTLDGAGVSSSSSSNNVTTLSLTTTKANDEIIVLVAFNGCTGGVDTVSAISAHLTFSVRTESNATPPPACSGAPIIELTAQASSPLTSEIITVTASPGAGVVYSEALAFGINGINTGSPFDTNPSVPAIATSGALTMSTSHPTNFLFAGFRNGGGATIDPGWTQIIAGSFIFAEYQRVSSTQSTISFGGSNGNNGGIGDAVVSP